MLNSVILGIVEMQMQFVKGYVIPVLSVPAGQGNNQLSTKYTAVNNLPCGQKFIIINSLGLIKTANIALVALIV
jgi:hypothetical protein